MAENKSPNQFRLPTANNARGLGADWDVSADPVNVGGLVFANDSDSAEALVDVQDSTGQSLFYMVVAPDTTQKWEQPFHAPNGLTVKAQQTLGDQVYATVITFDEV